MLLNKKIKRSGIMLVVSSPSGAGKTTLARELISRDRDINLSISVTTRKPRVSEKNNKDYIFVSEKRFNNMIKKNMFLEHAIVFDNQYGTPRNPTMKKIKLGKDILFDIDWQGTQALKEKEPKHLVSVFILPPSTKELEKRLLNRGQDSKEEVKKRMAEASSEITHWAEYDYVIINDDLNKTLLKLRSILEAERLKRYRQIGINDFIRRVIS
ncbi:MAG: guanylate kinase [Rickettsiales bacterium TMED254]|nr:guanylate kinase [Rickettsiales bacterium]RPF77036.1 MAG: guanylate kinase [Rickettsiales bacterium TMED254]|tara:strand:- start:385 stop:1020 length:636 start_codon:yes stop_codon:yes gene_type:complete